MNAIFIEMKAIKIAASLRKFKKEDLIENLSKSRGIPVVSRSAMTSSQLSTCPNLSNKIAILIGKRPHATIFHMGSRDSALLPVIHEFAHDILGHTDDSLVHEKEANLLAALIVKWYFSWCSSITYIITFLTLLLTMTITLLIPPIFAEPIAFPSLLQKQESSGSNNISDLNKFTTYYWTNSGTVYHVYENCSHIKNRTNVNVGNINEIPHDKVRLCKTCEALAQKE